MYHFLPERYVLSFCLLIFVPNKRRKVYGKPMEGLQRLLVIIDKLEGKKRYVPQ